MFIYLLVLFPYCFILLNVVLGHLYDVTYVCMMLPISCTVLCISSQLFDLLRKVKKWRE